MAKAEIKNQYLKRVSDFTTTKQTLKTKSFLLGLLKLFFIIWTVFFILKYIDYKISFQLILGILGFISFIIFSIVHEKLIKRLNFLNEKVKINQEELIYLNHEFPDTADNGAQFNCSDHRYSSDLDVFGEHSLFHLINRCKTSVGKKKLSEWLKVASDKLEIKKRQNAIRELVPKIEFRQDLGVLGKGIDKNSELKDLMLGFLKEPEHILNKKGLILTIWIIPALTVLSAILLFFKIPFFVFLSFFVFQFCINLIFMSRITKAYKKISVKSKLINIFAKIIKIIENTKFKSEKLKNSKNELFINGSSASCYIKKLATFLEWFDVRNGMIHFLLNNIFLWDMVCLMKIENWKKVAGERVERWIDVVGEFEVLASGANQMFNQPDWIFPSISDSFLIKGEDVGHPLIPQAQRVSNDIDIQNEGEVKIITGPNMAGKSTYIRTIGVNLVMASAGFGVCAVKFDFTPVILISSMKNSDSLDKHLSLFYAELLRLKKILDTIHQEKNVFYLVDEMLKGTNAIDRQKGAIAFVKQLLKHKTSGIVATHDLKLTGLEKVMNRVSNYHFDGYIKDDKLFFDYQLKPGICQSFNALTLMKKMGIEV